MLRRARNTDTHKRIRVQSAYDAHTYTHKHRELMAINEIQRIRQATHAYMYADERSNAFKDAVAYLNKVHATYGTVDVTVISELTR